MSTKVDTELANVWTNILDIEKEIPILDSKVALSFATAIGLALRDFEHD
jgi:hypothetical protein